MMGYRITSPQDRIYNCVAWAAGDTQRWWWPLPPYAYWPPHAALAETLQAFVEAFSTLGYEVCDNRHYEDGFEKIALYVNADGMPKHAARQVGDRKWTSKLGKSFDVEHTLDGLEGAKYGTVALVLRRPFGG